MIRLALYQPEIAQNVGTLLRLSVCFGIPVDVIEPCGFPWNDAKMRRAGMDYLTRASVTRHASFDAFLAARTERLILFDVKASVPYHTFDYHPDDILLMGRESCGVPDTIFRECTSVRIPMCAGERSINIAVAAALGLAEALRTTQQFPVDPLLDR